MQDHTPPQGNNPPFSSSIPPSQIQAQFSNLSQNPAQFPNPSSTHRPHQHQHLPPLIPPPQQQQQPSMIGATVPPPPPQFQPQEPANPSPTSAGLDYETFWQLQQHLGVAPLRDNLNYAAAQNQRGTMGDMGLVPYHEPMYAYNGGAYLGSGVGLAGRYEPTAPPVPQQEQNYYYPPQETQGYTSPHSSHDGHPSSYFSQGPSTYHTPEPFTSSEQNYSSYPTTQFTSPLDYQTQTSSAPLSPSSFGSQFQSVAPPPPPQHIPIHSTTRPSTTSSTSAYPPPPHPLQSSQSSSNLRGAGPSGGGAQSTTQAPTPPRPSRRKTQLKRKRPRRKEILDDDDGASSSEDEDGHNAASKIGKGPDGKPVRLPGACTHCKKLKMKCEFERSTDTVCKRCRNTRHQCIVEGRKPRTQPNKREFLLAQIRQKDQIIEKLLKQIHSPIHISNPSDAPSDATTNPAYSANPDVVAWLEKAEASVRAGQGPFVLDGRADRDTDDAGSDYVSDDGGVYGGGLEGYEENGMLGVRDAAERERLHSLPDPTAPLGLIAKLSLATRSSRSRSKSGSSAGQPRSAGGDDLGDDDDDNVGVANESYFLPGPAANVDLRAALLVSHPPEILVHGLVSPEDVDNLFAIFYEKLNPFLSILDPKLHTPASTFSRCPFLFTVICAISSRYYTLKGSIYPIAMHFAKSAAAKNLIDGWKCVELCQAYILMSLYAMPARKWEDDRSWLYLGLAIRIATDLNLHHPTAMKIQNELHEREILNRTRTWMILFNLDRSTSTQFGKPSTIREDYIIHNSENWYLQSAYNHPYDIHLCSYSQLLRIIARFHAQVYNGPLGLKPDIDIHQMTLDFDQELSHFQKHTQESFRRHSDPNDAASVFRCKLTPFLVNYSRLVMFSFGFQRAFQQGVQRDDIFLDKCLNAASTVLSVFIDTLAPSGYMRYSPDGHFVFASFACAFLIKLLRADLVDGDRRAQIIVLINQLNEALSSPDVAIDDRHTPKLYARFLQSLLEQQIGEKPESGTGYSESPSTNETSGQSSTASDTHTQMHESREPQEPATPSISVEYGPPEGGTHVELLQGSDVQSRMPQSFGGHHPRHLSSSYDEHLSTVSSTVSAGGGDTATLSAPEEDDMLASMQILASPQFFDHMLMPPFNPVNPATAQWNHTSEPEHYADPQFPSYSGPPISSQPYSHNQPYGPA